MTDRTSKTKKFQVIMQKKLSKVDRRQEAGNSRYNTDEVGKKRIEAKLAFYNGWFPTAEKVLHIHNATATPRVFFRRLLFNLVLTPEIANSGRRLITFKVSKGNTR